MTTAVSKPVINCLPCSLQELGMFLLCYLVSGMQAVKMRDMPVSGLVFLKFL